MRATDALPAREPSLQAPAKENWKQALSNAITSPAALLEQLGLSAALSEKTDMQSGFRCRVPKAYLDKMQAGDSNDPLLRQVLPLAEENLPQGLRDPVGDLAAMAHDGLLHKYPARALLITTGACAVHCRYCFRRHYPYAEASYTPAAMDKTLDYLERHPDIDEVILSGGDPLVLDDEKLQQLVTALEGVSTVTTLRIHTRLPVVLPSRITTELTGLLANSRFRVTLVIHANHANELMQEEQRVLKQLHLAGVTLLNQSVLLKGVNDTASALMALSRRLHACYTLPYYLHMLDPVQGAMHFDCPQKTALEIIQTLREQLPGYLVPKLVREIPGNRSKTAIFSI